ncbi:hypothetical protein OQA88_1988 [Cercophora sp. LCS_1]
MSRSLDKDVASSLGTGDSLAAFQQISSLLLSQFSDGFLELEILGKSHPFPEGCYIVQDIRAAGVSKLGLAQAFLVARKVLNLDKSLSQEPSMEDIAKTTAVMLFMDPEHLTAANVRKRVILEKLAKPDADHKKILLTEKYFIDSLLTSRLHRHTKSPTLWSHLQWLLRLFPENGIHVDVLEDMNGVVMVAGERHPRNYYAWSHARFLARRYPKGCNGGVFSAVKSWCFQHHTDISGWTFLYFLAQETSPATSSLLLTEVLELVGSLRLANESMWVFLRMLAASHLVDDDGYSRFVDAGRNLLRTTKSPTDQAVVKSALQWSETYRVKG